MPVKDWAKFGQDIWDKAMAAHLSGAVQIVVPVRLDDGGICRVIIEPPIYTETRVIILNGTPHTQWRSGLKLSDGSIKWSEWR